jgi:peptidoglycan/xylan/chitin deacetylase (PgdA/CDA1 family)
LPDRSLLVTFDDGWDDNERHALGLLRKHNAPAVLFTVAGWVGQTTPWNEVLMRAWEDGQLGPQVCSQWWLRAGGTPEALPGDWTKSSAIHGLIIRLAALGDMEKNELLGSLRDRDRYAGRHLATLDQLKHLQSGGVSIESHGLTHIPIALAQNPRRELGESRREIAAMFPGREPAALSFPHGSYDRSIVQLAWEEGYQLLFTSDACLNRCENGRPARLLGRIAILEHEITDAKRQFSPSRMAQWLFRRPALSLN